MIKHDDFIWVLENTTQTEELQNALGSTTEYSGRRRLFFASVEEQKNLGFEVIDSFVCFCLNYDKKMSPWFWKEVNAFDIHTYLVNIISMDMAYGTEINDINESRALTDQFLALFKTPVEHIAFYSNYGWDSANSKPKNSGFGVTGATFEKIVIGLTKNRIGFLLAEDED